MIDFRKMKLSQKEDYEAALFEEGDRRCEYSFANQILWGRQEAAWLHGCVAIFAHFYGRSIYPYPIGKGDKKEVVRAILKDAKERGLPCRITGLLPQDCRDLNQWFPETFYFRMDRDGFDYVYAIDDLADLKGRKFQKKRNHLNRFRTEHPGVQVQPITAENLHLAQKFASQWYARREEQEPEEEHQQEKIALGKAFRHYEALKLEGLIMTEGDQVLAMTMGSRLSPDTFDIHFEKAWEDVDGAYPAINQAFAQYLREKYPEVKFLDREDDMGLEGLRKAKLSYNPHHMTEKYWAYLREELNED